MMRRLALAVALLLPATAALSETVEVRSGEHADFSRIVLMFDGQDGWTLGRVAGGYEFRAARGDLDFDLSKVFSLIPRTRIKDISERRPGALFLAVDCDCHADAFDLRGGRVVLDIKNGPPVRNASFERALEPLAQSQDLATAASAVERSPMLEAPPHREMTSTVIPPAPIPETTHASDLQGSAHPILKLADHTETKAGDAKAYETMFSINPFDQAAHSDAPEKSGPKPFAATTSPATEPNFDIAATERAQAFEAMVLDQLARAGSQGLIIPNTPFESHEEHSAETTDGHDAHVASVDANTGHAKSAPSPHESPVPGADGAVQGPAGGHVRVETVIDRDSALAQPEQLTENGSACVPSEELDIASWGLMPDGKPDLAAYREGLVGEFDDINPEAAMRLARYYAYLTFGAEALQELSNVDPPTPDRDLVAAIATIMDQDTVHPRTAYFRGQETCGTAAALWALLAGPELRTEQPVDVDAAIQAFTDLPDHIKRHLGPRLLDTFRAGGKLEAAQIVRNRIGLSGEGAEVEVAVSSAQLDHALGDAHKAEEQIADVLETKDPDSPEALLALAETRIEAGTPIDDELLGALEALAVDTHDTETGHGIDRAIAEAHLLRGEYREARDFALSSGGELDDVSARDLLRRVYMAASEKADAEPFLRLVLPHAEGLVMETADQPARQAIAARLVDLGFAGDALAVLGPLDGRSTPPARQIAARAELALNNPDGAIAALAPLNLDFAAPLLGKAEEMAGRYELARDQYARAGDEASAARMSVLLTDWKDAAVRAGNDPLGTIAEQLSVLPEPTPATEGAQQVARGLLESSRAERSAFEALLRGN